MIVHHREPADGDREDIGKFLQSTFDPFFAVEWSIVEQERAADAPGDAVVPAQLRTRRQGGREPSSWVCLLWGPAEFTRTAERGPCSRTRSHVLALYEPAFLAQSNKRCRHALPLDDAAGERARPIERPDFDSCPLTGSLLDGCIKLSIARTNRPAAGR